MISVDGERIGTQSIQHDQQHVRRASRRLREPRQGTMLAEQFAPMREADQGRDGPEEPGDNAPGPQTNVASSRFRRTARSPRRSRRPE